MRRVRKTEMAVRAHHYSDGHGPVDTRKEANQKKAPIKKTKETRKMM